MEKGIKQEDGYSRYPNPYPCESDLLPSLHPTSSKMDRGRMGDKNSLGLVWKLCFEPKTGVNASP